MDLRDSTEEAAFRAEVRAWLETNAPQDLRELEAPAAMRNLERVEAARTWSRKLADAGYAALTWPKEYGGGGAPHTFEAVFLEEMARADAPQHLAVIGLGMAGPTIIAHGTDAQKARYLSRILTAEEIWCQGFSEPGAGSDLAGLRTRSELRGDVFVVNGQKVWSSFAQIADWCLLVTRSDAESQGHKGLTYLLVDMHSPGIEVRPLREATGDAVFNEIFFTDVEVPVENVLEAIGEGWRVAMTTLLHERATLGFALVGSLEKTMRRVIALAKERGVDDPRLHDRIAEEWLELQALKLTNQRSLSELERRGQPGPEGSVIKLRWSEANQRLTKLALELHGAEGPVAGEDWRYNQIRARANTIEAGTSEVLRNIVAERVLGLPRSR